MTGTPRSPEFQAAAVQRVVDGETRAEVAADLDVAPSSLSRWCLAAGLPPEQRGGRRSPVYAEKEAVAREMVAAGTPRPIVAERLGVRRSTVLKWTADLDDPAPRPPARESRGGLQDDGIIDEVAVERALRFDPAAIAALRPSEYRVFTTKAKALIASPWFEQTPRYEAWLALPEVDRLIYAADPARRARAARARTERISA